MRWIFILFCMLQAGILNAQTSTFDTKIAKIADALVCPVADEQKPVTLNAELVNDVTGDSVAVVIKANLAKGWHIYAFVPENQPYIVAECIVELDGNLRPVGTWVKSVPIASTTDKGVFIYEDKAVFIHKFKKISPIAKGKIGTGLSYQTCNLLQCLPPVDVKMELTY